RVVASSFEESGLGMTLKALRQWLGTSRLTNPIDGVKSLLMRKGRLLQPWESWFTHTEGKVIWDLWQRGLLVPGRVLRFMGELPPCPGCQSILRWASKEFKMTITYVDEQQQMWQWVRGIGGQIR